MREGNGTRELGLNARAAKIFAEELALFNQANGRFAAVFKLALAQAGETGGRFVHLEPKEDGTATLVVEVSGNGKPEAGA